MWDSKPLHLPAAGAHHVPNGDLRRRKGQGRQHPALLAGSTVTLAWGGLRLGAPC